MDKPLVSFSIENFITIGLIAAFWYVVIVGGSQLARGVLVSKKAAS